MTTGHDKRIVISKEEFLQLPNRRFWDKGICDFCTDEFYYNVTRKGIPHCCWKEECKKKKSLNQIAKWRDEHKEELNQKQKDRRKNNESYKKREREYYQNNCEKLKEYHRTYYDEHKEEIGKKMAKYYQRNKVRILQQQKEYKISKRLGMEQDRIEVDGTKCD